MFREMRRKKQKLTEKQCIDILKKAKTATLALHGDDGYPYSVPVNYMERFIFMEQNQDIK